MKTILIWLLLFCGVAYGDAVIFSGTDVKALKANIQLFDQAKIMSGTVNPSSSATTANKGSLYLNTSSGLVYRKTDNGSSTNWSSYNSANLASQVDLINCSITASVASSALTIALKDSSGSDPSGGSPCTIAFRNSTATTGSYSQVALAAAASVVVSNGSSLGGKVSSATNIFVYAINNSGTIELAVSTRLYKQDDIVSTTAEGGAGAADSRIMYSTTARTNVAHRLLAYVTVSPAASYAWTNAPTKVAIWPFEIPGPIAKAIEADGTTVVSHTAFSTVTYATIDYDNYGMYGTGTGVFTAPWDGQYAYGASAEVTAIAGGSHCIMRMAYNSTSRYHYGGNFRQGTVTGSGKCAASIGGVIKMSAGDTIRFQMTFDDTTADRNLINNGDFNIAEVAWVGF